MSVGQLTAAVLLLTFFFFPYYFWDHKIKGVWKCVLDGSGGVKIFPVKTYAYYSCILQKVLWPFSQEILLAQLVTKMIGQYFFFCFVMNIFFLVTILCVDPVKDVYINRNAFKWVLFSRSAACFQDVCKVEGILPVTTVGRTNKEKIELCLWQSLLTKQDMWNFLLHVVFTVWALVAVLLCSGCALLLFAFIFWACIILCFFEWKFLYSRFVQFKE